MNKIDYDFIEIGTSCFDAMIERATTEHGISVEPLGFYLDMLPSKPNVKKVVAALVSDEEFARSGGILLTYFVDNDTIIKHNLGGWMLGCNSVGRPHDFHTRWCPPEYVHRINDADVPARNLVEEGLVQVVPAKCYTYSQLVQEFNVGTVRYLKLDTEGNDAVILNSILNYYINTDLKLLPKTIKFEHNFHNKAEDIIAVKEKLVSLGYTIENGLHDATAHLIQTKWQKDLAYDIRTNTYFDDVDWIGFGVSDQEITDCNIAALSQRFMSVRDNCRAILDIGIHRQANGARSLTEIFLQNKFDSTIYVGIDVEDRTYLNNPAKNIFTIKADSSDYEANMQLIKSLGIIEFDFIFIDGWHSINQCLKDWEYTNILSDHGIVGFHDTRVHPGPQRFLAALDTNKWHVEHNVCNTGSDWGIGFVKKK